MTQPCVESPTKVPSVKLLAGFARQDRRDLLARGIPFEVGLLETFMQEGDRDLNLYLILSGHVSTWREGVRLGALGAGEVLNETKLFLPRPNRHSARAEAEGTLLLRLPRVELLGFFRDRPERLMKVFVLNLVAIQAFKLEDCEESIIAGVPPALQMGEA